MGEESTIASGAFAKHRPFAKWEQAIRTLSDRLVAAQRPIRVLDAIKWDDAVERSFFAMGARELPAVGRDFYVTRPLPFDPTAKRLELVDLERDVLHLLGVRHPAAGILLRMCAEYREVVDLLTARGTPQFGLLSRRLYGTSLAKKPLAGPVLGDLAGRMAGEGIGGADAEPDPCPLDAMQTVAVLTERLGAFFGDPRAVRIRLSDGIVADAAAGCDYLKIRRDACFTQREVRVLEVHEGWVHLGTTLNGQAQPICTFLSKGPPSSAATQEGLAVLTEVWSGASHPGRVRRLANRVAAVGMAEAGADFREVYRFFIDRGCAPREGYKHTMRIFRGSLPAGAGPFTKDLVYGQGFARVSRFVQKAMSCGQAGRVPLLFCGKTNLDDAGILAQLFEEGLVVAPRFVPPPCDEKALQTLAPSQHVLPS